MAGVEGVAQGARIEQEGSSVVLRFVLQTDGERIPVEMRGKRVSGVLQDGDRVRIEAPGHSVRGRDGVARPAQVANLSTNSVISVPGGGMFGGAMGLVASLGISVITGAISTVLVSAVTGAPLAAPPLANPPLPQPGSGLLVPLLIGLVVAGIIFFLIYLRPRLRRGA